METDKTMYVTQTAKEKFEDIVRIVGGKNEQLRAKELLERVIVVRDQPSERSKRLLGNAKIKEQHILVFGTGAGVLLLSTTLSVLIINIADFYEGTTMTSNTTFVRLAQDHGITFSVWLHPARALTEQKTDAERSHVRM